MNHDFITLLKERADIVNIINQYVSLKQSGSNYKACCPFHKEKTPSFTVNPQRQSFKCFGCGKGGDVLSFIQEIEHIEFFDAVSLLADKVGLEVPKERNFDPQKKDSIKEIKEINLMAARYYYKNLTKSSVALEYLKNRRVSAQMIREFGLGYADESNSLMELLAEKFSEERILESGIARKNEYGVTPIFKDRIIFPIFNFKNEIIAFGGRQLGSWGPKYINSPETMIYQKKENLYGIQIARKNITNKAIFLVEGYLDVISMHQNGYKNTVATLGTALTDEQAKILSRLASNVFILYDSDEAGQKAAKKALELIETNGASCRVITLDEEKDPDEFFRKKTPADFYKKIEESVDFLKFNIQFIQKQHDIETSIGKENFVRESVDFIKQYNEKPYARQIYTEESIYYLSDLTGYSIKSLGVDIFGKYFSPKMFRRSSMDEDQPAAQASIEIETELDNKEKIVLYGLFKKKIHFDEISIEDFVYLENQKKYHQIKEGQEVTFEDTLQELSHNEYTLLIKSIKMAKLSLRIAFLEKKQEELLRTQKSNSVSAAIIIGNEIIRLKGILNKM